MKKRRQERETERTARQLEMVRTFNNADYTFNMYVGIYVACVMKFGSTFVGEFTETKRS